MHFFQSLKLIYNKAQGRYLWTSLIHHTTTSIARYKSFIIIIKTNMECEISGIKSVKVFIF